MSAPTIEVVTAAQAEERQRRAAGGLRQRGCRPGDRVAFCLPSSVALLTTVLGALRTGVVPVMLNATLLPHERQALVDDARPRLTITEASQLAELAASSPVELAEHPLSRPMHYTSGTTGRPKGVWAGLWDERTAAAAFEDEADLWSFGPDDVHLVCSPMYHSVSTRFAAGTLLRGGTCVVLGRFEPAAAIGALRGEAGAVPTTTFMAPAALQRLFAALDDDARQVLGHLRLLAHAGSACPPAVKHAALDVLLPDTLWEFYGSTEGQFTACSPEEWLARPGTVGRARPGRTLATDADGTIWCRPPAFGVFRYWEDDVKTESAWRDGYFTVGDLGRLDAGGYLFIDGRRDDLIISGGVNVYPAEVEAVLSEVDGVADVAVFGMPDARWGERVCAALVARPGQVEDRLSDAVADYALSRLAPYKRPKQYVVVEDLPRTATGKVQRHRLSLLAGEP